MALLLQHGTLFDGTGAAPFAGDILVEDGRIAAVGETLAVAGAECFDCTGLAVAPGFIDSHSHSDLQVLENATEKTRQGVTSEVVGNCGFSPFPCGTHMAELREFANGILCGGGEWGWESAASFLGDVRRRAHNSSVFPLAGHGSLRIAQVGLRQGPLGARELRALEASLEDALDGGAVGFSTGLMYAPGSSAPSEELQRLCSIIARRGAIYCTHIRNYAAGLLDAVEEQLALARATGCRLQISHLQTVGRQNWPYQQQVLERIEAAHKDGIDVEFDIYPYLAGSTVLTQLLPQRALDGGNAALLARLRAPATRRHLARETDDALPQAWEDILITGVRTPANQAVLGWTITEIAAARSVAPVEAALDLLLEEDAEVNIISFNQSEENLRVLLSHPLCTVISDGFYVKGRPHPRLFGTFAELLGRVVRERGWLTLPEAIHKITGKPAARFGLRDRGLLRAGAWADITVFDPSAIASPATYTDPCQSPVGVELVLKEGRVVHSARQAN